jgi:hypothetical protein
MDGHQFDLLSRWVVTSTSRRATRRALAAGAIVIGLGRFGQDETEAKRNRKKKLKKNEFGCVNVGGKCRGKDSVCCSGICQGKKPKKGKQDKSKCVAHNAGACQAGQIGCAGPPVACGDNGFCLQTTGNASFCGTLVGVCADCTKDTDCEATQGEGAACIVVCPGQCPDSGGRGCFPAAA